MLRSFYQIGAAFYPAATLSSMENSEQPTQSSSLSSIQEIPCDGRRADLNSLRRSSVRFSQVSSMRMLPVEEVEEVASVVSSSASGQSSHEVSSDSSAILRNSCQSTKQGRRPMGYKSRRRRVHRLLMDDYASRRHQQHAPARSAVNLPEECLVLRSSASYSDVSTTTISSGSI